MHSAGAKLPKDEQGLADIKQEPSDVLSTTSNSSIGRDETAERPKKNRRTFLTQNACTRCRQKKSKCDGKRPMCGRCEKHGAECQYDVAQEGMTRMQNLQQQLDSKNGDYAKLMNLFSALQNASDQEATTLLARLRLGTPIDDLLSLVEESQASSSGTHNDPSQSQFRPTPGYMHSLPPSPLDERSWTSWNARCEAEDQSMSHPSQPQLDGLRPGARLLPPDGNFQGHKDFYGSEPHDGYYHSVQDGNFPSQHQINPYGPGQWQNAQFQDGNVRQEVATPRAQFAVDSAHLPDGHVQQRPQSHAGKDGLRKGTTRGKRS